MACSRAPRSVDSCETRPEILQTVAAEAQERVGGGVLRQLGAAGTRCIESYEAGIESEQARGRFGSVVGIAVDGADAFLGRRRAQHGVEKIAALGLEPCEPFGIRLLAEGGAGALEGRQHARRIDLGAFRVAFGTLRRLDALGRGLGFALVLGDIAVDGGDLALEADDAGGSLVALALGLSQARVVRDQELALQLFRLGGALAKDRSLAALERAFHAAVFRVGLDALGGDGLPGCSVGALRLRQLGFQRADAGLDALQFGFQFIAPPEQRGLVAFGAGDAFLLLGDAAPPILHLGDEIFLDLALRPLRLLGQPGELRIVGLPAVGFEQALGLGKLDLLRPLADVGDHAADLVQRADLGGPLSLLGREDGVEVRVEGKEHRGSHRGQEHHPQHRVLGDQAHALHVGRGDVAAAAEVEGDDGDERDRKQEIERDVGEPAPVGDQPGRPRETDGAVLIEQPVERQTGERHAEQHAHGGLARREASARSAALVHAGGEALADQPGHDQHHALDAEGDQDGKAEARR